MADAVHLDEEHQQIKRCSCRLPECWIPPGHIMECRALLETYHDLRAEHTAWVQRIHGPPGGTRAALSEARKILRC
jgi:hypothetical protein